jgi:HEAT repeat protein
MSAAWERFLAQYNAEGLARLDGYSAALLDALDGAERARAHAMILARADALQTPEIRALALLATPEAVALVEALGDRDDAPPLTRIAVCEAAWSLTHDLAWQQRLLALIDHGDAASRPRALNALCAMPLGPPAAEFAVGLLRIEADASLAVQLAKALLRHRGVAVDTMADFSRQLPRVRALTQPNLHDRGEALDRFVAEGAASPSGEA